MTMPSGGRQPPQYPQGGWNQPQQSQGYPAQSQQFGYGPQPGYSAQPGYPAQSGCGQQPSGPQFSQAVPEPTAFKLLKAGLIGLMVLYVLWAAHQLASYVTGIQEGVAEVAEQGARAGAGALAITFGVFMALVGLGLYLLVFFLLWARKDGGRVAGIVFAFLGVAAGALNVVMALATFFVIDAVLTIMYLGVTTWWLVLAFDRPVRRYLQVAGKGPWR